MRKGPTPCKRYCKMVRHSPDRRRQWCREPCYKLSFRMDVGDAMMPISLVAAQAGNAVIRITAAEKRNFCLAKHFFVSPD